MKRAVFPGSFDPITLGHVDIIERALPFFDEIVVAIGVNEAKTYMWSLEERMAFISEAFAGNSKIKVMSYKGLTAAFCKEQEATCILRGLRNTTDFTYEQTIAQANDLVNGVDTVFLMCSPQYSHISSSIVRDIARNNGDFSSLVPAPVK
ncbi:pantetheine-phosphate adenylyltransferase [Altibacter sp.]|uniref:pantetheine-phosphate adenylyltransferase n=1 Tax=Altibacter sp. TaxID=2024823 RepID=UPI000C961C63|nr:pantetheine-phosphate adenylyltransferase [Altibacter sp.]MAP54765.1 pantetheine-phosphate adenylyltransferase [Altibacter sp.]|tara:strand:- start:651 stop:1100 length:450 start_codon:yes stop_codon:yes gene_type:complete